MGIRKYKFTTRLKDSLTRAQRKNLASRIESARFHDKTDGWERRRNLVYYSDLLGTDLGREISRTVGGRKKPLRLLDIGCGAGYFLADVKKVFKEKVETHGLRVRLFGSDYLGAEEKRDRMISKKIDQLHIGSIENYKFSKKFDLIVSAVGSAYAASQAHVAEKVCSLLAVKGKAILVFPNSALTQSIVASMSKQGYVVAQKVQRRYNPQTRSVIKFLVVSLLKPSKRVPNLNNLITKELRTGVVPTVTQRVKEFSREE